MKAQTIQMACAFLFLIFGTKAQTIFDKSYDYNSYSEFAYSVQVTPDSGYLSFAAAQNFQTGLDQPLLLVRMTEMGNVSGLNAVAGDSLYWYPGLSGSLVRTFDMNFAGGGAVGNYFNTKAYGVLVKYNSIPDTLFLQKYEYSDFDAFYNTVETSDHGFALIGFSGKYDSATMLHDDDIWLVKTDSVGNVQAQATYGGTEDDLATIISEISNLRLLIGGVKIQNSTKYIPWILVTDFSGNLMKEKKLNDPKYYHCGGSYIIPAKDNAFLFRGFMDTLINNYDALCPPFIGKMDTDFNFIWQTIFTDSLIGQIGSVRQLPDSSIVFVGFKGYNYYGWICKLDKNGNKLWEHKFQHGSSTFNIFADFQQTPWDKGFILTGSTVDNFNQNIWLVKLDSNGMLLPDTINTGTFEVSGEQLSLQVFPNPVWDQLAVMYNVPSAQATATFSLYDLHGREIKVMMLDSNQHQYTLDVSTLPGGIYLAELRTTNGIITKKLLKQ
jgi:hypothetical protein